MTLALNLGGSFDILHSGAGVWPEATVRRLNTALDFLHE
jgi:hypothetical protein